MGNLIYIVIIFAGSVGCSDHAEFSKEQTSSRNNQGVVQHHAINSSNPPSSEVSSSPGPELSNDAVGGEAVDGPSGSGSDEGLEDSDTVFLPTQVTGTYLTCGAFDPVEFDDRYYRTSRRCSFTVGESVMLPSDLPDNMQLKFKKPKGVKIEVVEIKDASNPLFDLKFRSTKEDQIKTVMADEEGLAPRICKKKKGSSGSSGSKSQYDSDDEFVEFLEEILLDSDPKSKKSSNSKPKNPPKKNKSEDEGKDVPVDPEPDQPNDPGVLGTDEGANEGKTMNYSVGGVDHVISMHEGGTCPSGERVLPVGVANPARTAICESLAPSTEVGLLGAGSILVGAGLGCEIEVVGPEQDDKPTHIFCHKIPPL